MSNTKKQTNAQKKLLQTGSHGGARLGAGRKSGHGETTIVMRVPLSLVPKVEEMIANLVVANSSNLLQK